MTALVPRDPKYSRLHGTANAQPTNKQAAQRGTPAQKPEDELSVWFRAKDDALSTHADAAFAADCNVKIMFAFTFGVMVGTIDPLLPVAAGTVIATAIALAEKSGILSFNRHLAYGMRSLGNAGRAMAMGGFVGAVPLPKTALAYPVVAATITVTIVHGS